jgi:hypothetical protein
MTPRKATSPSVQHVKSPVALGLTALAIALGSAGCGGGTTQGAEPPRTQDSRADSEAIPAPGHAQPDQAAQGRRRTRGARESGAGAGRGSRPQGTSRRSTGQANSGHRSGAGVSERDDGNGKSGSPPAPPKPGGRKSGGGATQSAAPPTPPGRSGGGEPAKAKRGGAPPQPK